MGRAENSTIGSTSVMVTDHERKDGNKKYTVYKIVFERDSRLITAVRRYNEFLTFYSKDRATMFEWTLNKQLEFKNSVSVSPAAKDLLSKMLAKNKDERLGSVNDFQDIRSHEFFHSMNWALLEQRKIDPPFIPNLSNSQTDTSNFDPNFTSLRITDSVSRPVHPHGLTGTLLAADRTFEGFSYVPPASEEILAF